MKLRYCLMGLMWVLMCGFVLEPLLITAILKKTHGVEIVLAESTSEFSNLRGLLSGLETRQTQCMDCIRAICDLYFVGRSIFYLCQPARSD